ncbi:MAG: WecB/TagA/CpsF family glycosyltransferase [Candidatus Peregrinibacteria bacterium]
MHERRIDILGVPFDAVTYEDALSRVEGFMEGEGQVYLTTPNPEMLVEASKNAQFLEVLQGSALAVADGTGILWAATYLEAPKAPWGLRHLHLLWSLFRFALGAGYRRRALPTRVTGTDLMEKMVELSARRGWRIFLLGAREGVAAEAAIRLKAKYPSIRIVQAHAGHPSPEEEEAITSLINTTAPDLLFVAYGHPTQEFWIHRHLHRLRTVKVAMGVGGAFDFIAGQVKRAPGWMRRAGLEWLWRLFCEPRRFGRIWRATFVFIRLVMRKRFT